MRALIVSIALASISLFQVSCASRAGSGHTITVAQSGTADVIGNNSAALRKAVDLARPGDTVSIGAGTYEMENSLVVPSGVTVRGVSGRTILRKSRGVESALAEDGDYGQRLLVVAEPDKFHAGMGVTAMDDKLNDGWDISIASVTAVEGRYLRIEPMTIRDYDREHNHARVRNIFPVLCARNAENVVFEDLIVDGNRAENAYLGGCLGGAIYLYQVRNATVRNCVARNFNGDGISFQITDNVRVLNCESYGHAGFGVHPGTGSANPVVENCRIHNNGKVGLFLCWRVQHGQFRKNVIEENGNFGISIGHKDTDNEFLDNTIARNGFSGVYFREENAENSGDRNSFRNNKVVDNGGSKEGYGFYIAPHASDLVIEGNQIAETRSTGRTQQYGVFKLAGAGSVRLDKNTMAGHSEADYRETAAPVHPLP
jgi:hypothetical protein